MSVSSKNPSVSQITETEDQAQLTLLSHDIRSAISDVIGGLRLVDLDALDATNRLQLERVRTASEVLARLTEEALTRAAENTGSAESISSNLQLLRLLQNIRLRWSGRAQEKGLLFEITVESSVPNLVALDRIAMERILSNMLSNAIKYTDSGKVTLKVNMCGDAELCFIVTDDGPGFSEQALERLYQFEGRPDKAAKPGTGLGLHIVKDIADQIGGILRVQNNPEGGSSVTLRLPSDVWHNSTSTAHGDSLPDLTDVKILVAEDNETNQLILAQMLDVMGAEYEIAPDGVEALNWLERETFDIALIDIDMPRLSGIDVMRTLRSDRSTHKDMPILAITAFVLRANREAIYRAGANRILAKPIINIEALGQSISALLSPDSEMVQIPSAENQQSRLDDTRFQRLLEIAGPQGAQELLSRLTDDLENVQEQMRLAVQEKDQAGLRAHTHVLISLAGAVGADQLHSLAQVLNSAAHKMDHSAIARLGDEAFGDISRLLDFIASEREKRTGAHDA